MKRLFVELYLDEDVDVLVAELLRSYYAPRIMPKFPTYRGELPKCLNPLNPRHWFLPLYWIYFRPTALKCYLYQASPELYCAGPR